MFSPRELSLLFKKLPNAYAEIFGSYEYPFVMGWAMFYQTRSGVLVLTEITGLPRSSQACENSKFGLQIHEGYSCTGTEMDPFYNAGLTYNPQNCPPTEQAGNLPPLLSNSAGNAFMAVFTSNFFVTDIVGRTIVIHDIPDSESVPFPTSWGKKIACGEIIRTG